MKHAPLSFEPSGLCIARAPGSVITPFACASASVAASPSVRLIVIVASPSLLPKGIDIHSFPIIL